MDHTRLEKRRLHKLATEFTWVFWMCYFWYGSAADFAQNYGHVWSQHCPHWAISLFIDNGRHQFVPCDEDWSDKELLKHLISFYNAARFCGIPFETVGLRSVRRIEIAKVGAWPSPSLSTHPSR
ncbi:hypothetical protein SLS55_005904 [Diplodia seriata]|uniref:Uncharacterized protein n=1 Tax=Diplodia seriata TaxID=420778 RepID=A0ABR3CHP2_9PEZI